MKTLKETLESRKERIESRLREYDINDTSITFLRYLIFDDKLFVTPYEVGCRIMIIYAIVFSIQEPDRKSNIFKWFKTQKLDNYLSSIEMQYFQGTETEDYIINKFSWELEAAYILAWTLNLIKESPSPTSVLSDEQLELFFNSVPALGDELSIFLNNLQYRNTEEIFEENIFYELTTSYFRNLLFNSNEDNTIIDRNASLERHKALNWVRQFMEIKEWEHTETST